MKDECVRQNGHRHAARLAAVPLPEPNPDLLNSTGVRFGHLPEQTCSGTDAVQEYGCGFINHVGGNGCLLC